jgi:hypothetical protein
MFCHQRIGDDAMFAESARSSRLVESHQPGIAGHVGGQYRRQPALYPDWAILHHGAQSNLPHILYDESDDKTNGF